MGTSKGNQGFSFRRARPAFSGQMPNLLVRLTDRALRSLSRASDLIRQFDREGVFVNLLLVLGLMVIFGFLFLAVESKQQHGMSFWDTLVKGNYWAAVTLATVGYGDIVPHTIAGRIMSIILIFLAMGFVALFTANLTSALTAKKIREGRGLTNARQYSNHLLILGWKKHMSRVLENIVVHGKVNSTDVVLVCSMTDALADELQAHPKLSGIRLIKGSHYSEEHIMLANPSKAAGILILADESSAGASEFEIDSRTVMAAMILSRHVRQAHVVAELLDPAYEQYLKNTRIIDEIIFPKLYGRHLIGISAANIGVINTLNVLMSDTGGSSLTTFTIPRTMTGKTMRELRDQMGRERPNLLIIGLIENAGKYFDRKTEAIKEAQLTPDMQKLVENLKKAKQLENNTPWINPPGNHVIQPNTLAIAIEGTEARE